MADFNTFKKLCPLHPLPAYTKTKILIFLFFWFFLFTEHTQVTPGLPMLQDFVIITYLHISYTLYTSPCEYYTSSRFTYVLYVGLIFLEKTSIFGAHWTLQITCSIFDYLCKKGYLEILLYIYLEYQTPPLHQLLYDLQWSLNICYPYYNHIAISIAEKFFSVLDFVNLPQYEVAQW